MENKNVVAVVYDNNGQYYFLIMQKENVWSFCHGTKIEGESEVDSLKRLLVEKTGIKAFKAKKLNYNYTSDSGNSDVYFVEYNMNLPVILKEHNTYLWTTKDSVMNKLSNRQDINLFNFIVQNI